MTEELELIAEESQDSLIGTRLADRYEILSLIGEGGMGLVYKARHIFMHRLVAIKIVRQELVANSMAQQRFQQEAQAISQLKHRNIVDVYDFGISPDGTPYLVMDYLQGISLTDLIRSEGRLAPARALNLFMQACRALNHAHQHGIIHRDFKASNIMICPDDEGQEVVKIVDFGMAKLLRTEASGPPSLELTQQGDVFGSPLYMSPEQCKGQKLDERSDIYSLGCVMYLTLTGAPPFVGDNVLDTMQKQINEFATPCSYMVGDAEFPAAMDDIVAKALSKEPEERYQSIPYLAGDLQAVIAGQTVLPGIQPHPLAKPPHPAQKYLQLVQGKTVEIHLGLTAILIALCVGLACFVSGRMFEIASDDKEINLWVDYNQAGEKAKQRGQFKRAEQCYLLAITEANKFGRKDPRLAKSMVSLGATYLEDKQLKKAESCLRRAVDILKACYGDDCQELAGPYMILGRVFAQEGKLADAEDLQKKAVDLVDGDFAANNKKMAGMLTEYAKLKRQQGDAAGAKDIEDRVQQMSKQRKRG